MTAPIGVLFDLDGTLLDFEESSGRCLNEALGAFLSYPADHPRAAAWESTERDATLAFLAEKDLAGGQSVADLQSTARPEGEPCWVSPALHSSIIGTKKENWSRVILQSVGLLHEGTDAPVAAGDRLLSPELYAARWAQLMHDRHYEHLVTMPGAEALLAFLRSKKDAFRVALATSSDREHCHVKIARHPSITDTMQEVICGCDVVHGKPAPDIFLLAAEKIGVAPERCIVFEDAASGTKAGHAAGCRVWAVVDDRFCDGKHEWFDLAEHRLGCISDAIPLLEQMLSE